MNSLLAVAVNLELGSRKLVAETELVTKQPSWSEHGLLGIL